jgi:hypothetical protein
MFNLLFQIGNQCDQRFSILATQFKSEITTIESLIEKIENSPMTPKPKCVRLWYIFDWNNYITPQLADPPLSNHSKYNSFIISLEDGEAKFRGKKLPQHSDSELVPRAGIRLVKANHGYGPVGTADFRIEKIKFDSIQKGINIFLSKLPLEKRMSITTSWDALRSTLEALPKRSGNLQKMILTDFPLQTEVIVTAPSHLVPDDDIPQLTGDLHPEEIVDGSIEDEAALDMDVCIYTTDKKSRPWLGRIVKLLENKRFMLQWYSRKSVRSSVFYAKNNPDGSPYLNELSNETVMFWMMSEPQSRKSNIFALSPYSLQTIQREYEEIDQR